MKSFALPCHPAGERVGWGRGVVASGAIADERSGRAVDAAAVLLALAIVDRYHLDAVLDEPLCGGVTVVDGEQHLAGTQGEQVAHGGVGGVVRLDPLDL